MLENLKRRLSGDAPSTPLNDIQETTTPTPAPLLTNKVAPETPDNTALIEPGVRRTALFIRDEITEALKRRPMTRHELAHAVHSSPATIARHLDWLERVRVVETFAVGGVNVWRLVR